METNQGQQNPNKGPQKTIRTYASDVAEAVKEGQGSTMKIAMAENRRKQEELSSQTDPKEKKKYLVLGASFLIIGLIVFGIIFIFGKKNNETPTPQINQNQSLIFFDTTRQIDITGVNREEIKRYIADVFTNASPRLNTIEGIYLTERLTEDVGTPIDTQTFFRKIESQIPAQLERSLGKNISFGVYAFDGNAPFILLSTDSYELAFANMLVYERIFFDELYSIFSFDGQDYRYLFSKSFEDVVIRNQDARALFDTEGKVVIYYTFVGDEKQNLLIGTKESVVTEVVRRISGGTKLR
jgi:hypothetical protein